MADRTDAVFFPESHAEMFAEWGRHPDAALFAGGTSLALGRGGRATGLPPVVVSLEKIEEMRRISRSERYLEIGAMVRLGGIIELRKFVPGVLVQCLRGVAGSQVREMATIGGNILLRRDAVAALTALEAQYELRTAQSSRWVTAARFSTEPGPGSLAPQEALCRIRVPLDAWDFSAYRKFAGRTGAGRSAVFLARHQKNTLADIRIVCKGGDGIWRDRDDEIALIGKRLPLTRRIAVAFVARWETFLRGAEGVDELYRKELVNFLEANVANLVE